MVFKVGEVIFMKIGLVSECFKNRDIEYNVEQIKKRLIEARDKNIDLVCFGEAFLQGFDALSWNYEGDLSTAISKNDEIINSLKMMAKFIVTLITKLLRMMSILM
jgi:predicted amidohydrolase